MKSVNIFSQRNKKLILNKKISVSIYHRTREIIYNIFNKYDVKYDNNFYCTDYVMEELLIYQDKDRRIHDKLVREMNLKNFLVEDYPSSTLDAIEVFAIISNNEEFVKDINNIFYNNELPYELKDNQINISNHIKLPKNNNKKIKELKEDIDENIIRKRYPLVCDRLHTYYGFLLEEYSKKLNINIKKDRDGHIIYSSTNKEIAERLFSQNIISEFEKCEIIYANSLLEKYNTIRNDKTYVHPNEIINNESAEFLVQIFTATITLLDNCINRKAKEENNEI